MHAVALRALRTAQNPASRQACRLIAGSRYPLSRRAFHQSAISYQSREDPNSTDDARGQNATSKGTSVVDEAAADERVLNDSKQDVENPSASDAVENVEDPDSTQKVRIRGNGFRRISRLKQPEGLPVVVLPDWFWNNVKCLGEEQRSGSLAVYYTTNEAVDPSQGSEDAELPAKSAHAVEGIIECGLSSTQDAKYTVHLDVYREILSSIRAGLSLRPSTTVLENKNLTRPVLHLECPKDGSAFFLDSIVETIATKLEADLITLNPLDLAQITGPYLDEDLAWTTSSNSLLGYETAKIAGKLEEFDKESNAPAEDAEEMEDDGETSSISKMPTNISSMMFRATNAADAKRDLSAVFTRLSGWALKAGGSEKRQGDTIMPFGVITDPNAARQSMRANQDSWKELKKSTILEALVSGADLKRARDLSDEEELSPRDLIIQVQDYKELTGTRAGMELIDQLRAIVNKRWQGGQNVMIVGTSAMEEAVSMSEIQRLQSDIVEGEKRTIFVPNDRREEQDTVFESDERLRIRTINIRHIQDMVNKLAGDKLITVDIEKDLDTASAYSAGLEDAVWTYPRVQRLATMMLGLDKNPDVIDGQIFTKAQHFLSESDNAKYAWGEAELKEEDDDVNNVLDEMNNPATPQKIITTKEKLKQIRKNCNNHEKKLLNGVVIPSDIHTTFSDVHVPKETVEALKTLTSLSLLRPEAFTYGVLATDKIPGLLLYGPPGTGKTLLAKAVAKESGATVLEISGAEVNDMYVGEGEKNVRAIFTLAKKLSPCVVFIDEADAIFAARGEARRSSTHRELINQFLREWDGMNDLSAFIMVATNRPFDLDEAVLRRLPRRLLVDLPVEKDREAILRIHLKDEILDESVSLPKLAKNTPFYSGSDLKNLSVAAALACIREENEVAAKHVGDEPYSYPEKRILTKKHFDKAMEEISASISEDMSTLSAIRKFDEKYGDRKGRRKRNAALGFGGTTVPEKDSESGRVRKSTAEADV
ncbi:mitochondrial aaa atpase protein [Rutstroemia sp. NJR-2017a BVV2]|nr:mitochondrial aaa atpase protein [Rutstroemia sp. NJR-2017a BVV2]